MSRSLDRREVRDCCQLPKRDGEQLERRRNPGVFESEDDIIRRKLSDVCADAIIDVDLGENLGDDDEQLVIGC